MSLEQLVRTKTARNIMPMLPTNNSDSIKHWVALRESDSTRDHGPHKNLALRWSSSEEVLQSCCYSRSVPQTTAHLSPACSQKTSLLCFHPFLQPSTFCPHPTPPVSASWLDGRATSSCPQLAALGREGSSPRWISAVLMSILWSFTDLQPVQHSCKWP